MKKLLFGLSLVAVSAALADAGNVLIDFETQGPDTYADGTTVLDGECYALVWAKDGSFDGISATGDAVSANEEVIEIASRALNGKCRPTCFQIDSKVAPTGGRYEVWMLDTRLADGTLAAFDKVARKPAAINRAKAVASYIKQTVGVAALDTAKTALLADAAFALTAAPDGTPNPDIEAMEIVEKGGQRYARITFKDTSALLQYDVASAESPEALAKGEGTLAGKAQQGKGGDAKNVIEVPITDANSQFFQVQRN